MCLMQLFLVQIHRRPIESSHQSYSKALSSKAIVIHFQSKIEMISLVKIILIEGICMVKQGLTLWSFKGHLPLDHVILRPDVKLQQPNLLMDLLIINKSIFPH